MTFTSIFATKQENLVCRCATVGHELLVVFRIPQSQNTVMVSGQFECVLPDHFSALISLEF
jgi:hypothetical protein